jgi:hypothetical protein
VFYLFFGSDLAYLENYYGSDCSANKILSTETYFLGCNPSVNQTDFSGASTQFSVNMQCSAGSSLTPLSVVPGNGLSYVIQE